jgi:hypothetical protein
MKTKKNCHYRMNFRNKTLKGGGTHPASHRASRSGSRRRAIRPGSRSKNPLKAVILQPRSGLSHARLNDELFEWNDYGVLSERMKELRNQIIISHAKCFPGEMEKFKHNYGEIFYTFLQDAIPKTNNYKKLYYYMLNGEYAGHFTIMYNGTLSELDKYKDEQPISVLPSITAFVPETQMHLIFNVCVKEEYRNQGICTKMLKKIFDLNPKVPFAINVLVNNIPALKCYKKLGYMYLKQNDTYVYIVLNFNATFYKLVYYGHGGMGEVAPIPVAVPSKGVPFKSINYYTEPYTTLTARDTTNRILDICQDQIRVKEHSNIAISNMILTSNGAKISDDISRFGIYLCSDIGIVKLYGYYDLYNEVLLSDIMNHLLNDFQFNGISSYDFFSKIDLYLFACRNCPTRICPSKSAKYFDGRFGEQFPLSPTLFDVRAGGGTNKTKLALARAEALSTAAQPINILNEFKQVTMEEMVQTLKDNNKKTCPNECPKETSA